jgi:CBS-domain-containing membrane protein
MKIWRVDDVMTTAVVTVPPAVPYRELVDLLVRHGFGAVPVVDAYLRVTGVVSEADLLHKIEYAGETQPRLFEGRRRRGDRLKGAGRTAADLMSSPPVTVRSGTSIAAAARVMDSGQVRCLPVVDDRGRLIGIVSRSDLLKAHLRPDDDIRADVECGVLFAHLAGAASAVQVDVSDGIVTLTGRVDRWSTSGMVDRLVGQVAGVVEVVDKLEFDYDDSTIVGTGMAFGVA